MTTHRLRRNLVALLAPVTLLLMGAADHHHAGPAMNYHVIDKHLATGGHFVGDGLAALADDGLEVIIDLRPEDPQARRAAAERAGVKYVHVPVSWDDPRPEQFERFREAMDAHGDNALLVQCAANYRASAMTYLYRTLVAGDEESEARADMEAVWKPNRRWRNYMADIRERADER